MKDPNFVILDKENKLIQMLKTLTTGTLTFKHAVARFCRPVASQIISFELAIERPNSTSLSRLEPPDT